MARRRKSGDTEWVGLTGTIAKESGVSVSQILATVQYAQEAYAGAGQVLPPGTLLRTMGRISAFAEASDMQSSTNSLFYHAMAALHMDEAIKDDGGTLNIEPVQISQEDNLGFEGLFWLGSCILWKQLLGSSSAVETVTSKAGCMMNVDSKAKRVLQPNDCIIMDLAEVTQQKAVNYHYDIRLLIKHA